MSSLLTATNLRRAAIPATLIGAMTLPYWGYGALIGIVTLALMYGMLCLSWNVISGFAGQLNMATPAFFGIGAYGVAFPYAEYELSPYFGLLIGLVAAVLVAIGVAQLTFRSFTISGFAFILFTLALSELLRSVMRTVEFFGGAEGILLPFNPSLQTLQFRTGKAYYFLILILVSLAMVVTARIRNSGFGLRLAAIRESEDAALAAGINAGLHKTLALMISAAMASVAGGFYAVFIAYIIPDTVFSIELTVAVFVGTIVGGLGTVWGPLIGGAGVWMLNEALVRLPLGSGQGANLAVILYGLLLILCIHRLPEGIVGSLSGSPRWWWRHEVPPEKKEDQRDGARGHDWQFDQSLVATDTPTGSTRRTSGGITANTNRLRGRYRDDS